MNLRRLTTVLLFLFTSICALGQDSLKVDSLQKVLEGNIHDTARVKALRQIGFEYRRDLDVALDYYGRALELAKKKRLIKQIADTHAGLASVYYYAGDFLSALKSQEITARIWKDELKDEDRYLRSLNNLGILHKRIGNLTEALSCYETLLTYARDKGDSVQVASMYNNMGNLYMSSDQPEKALELHLKSLAIRESENLQDEVITSYGNLANVYDDLERPLEAIVWYKKALSHLDTNEIGIGLGNNLNNLGFTYLKLDSLDQAEHFLFRGLKVREQLRDGHSVAQSYSNAASLRSKQGRHQEALDWAKKALEICQALKLRGMIVNAYLQMAKAHEGLRNYEEALHYFDRMMVIKDSLQDDNMIRDIAEIELKHAYQREADRDSMEFAKREEIKDKELAITKAEREAEHEAGRRKGLMNYFFAGILLLVVVFTYFLYKRFQITKKQKHLIEEQKEAIQLQKEMVEQKNEEIIDSIQYAKRLQEAIIPTETAMKEVLPESFVLYVPKDIVAGDFYWVEQVGDTIFFAAADCTGHGVPGAMVSVVCSNALNRTIRELGVQEPGKILDMVRELVVATFEKSESDVKDGMDIALCSLSTVDGTLKFAGANNPLLIYREQEQKVEEYRGDKQPVGQFEEGTPFNTVKVDYQKGDTLYLFSDGYADQFGGPRGKKFKYSNFKKSIERIAQRPIGSQKSELEVEFNQWRGDLEQLDDICILGVSL